MDCVTDNLPGLVGHKYVYLCKLRDDQYIGMCFVVIVTERDPRKVLLKTDP